MNAIYKEKLWINWCCSSYVNIIDTTSNIFIEESNKTKHILIPPVSLVPAIHFRSIYYIYDHDANLFIDIMIYLYDPIDTPKTNIIECNITPEATGDKNIQPSVDENNNIL